MGIAEILEDYPEYSKCGNSSLSNLSKILKISDPKQKSDNFVLEATLLLRKWVETMGAKANVVMLTALFDNEGNHEAAGTSKFLENSIT